MSHTSVYNEAEKDQCGCEKKSEIPFLDTMVSIKEGYLDTDLYKKGTDRNQYLLPSSCHVKQTTTAIPYSLSLRIVRICRDPKNREKHFQNLKRQLLERDCPEKIIDSAILKARKVPRKFALQKVAKQKRREGPIFAVTHDPRLPALGAAQAKHWRTMSSRYKYLAEVFKQPPLIAYKRQTNLKGQLIRAKVAGAERPHPKEGS